MCFWPQRRAIFRHQNFKKCFETVSFWAFWLQNVLLASAACNFWGGCIFFLLTFALLHLLSADLTTLLCFSSAFQLSILSEVYYLNFLRPLLLFLLLAVLLLLLNILLLLFFLFLLLLLSFFCITVPMIITISIAMTTIHFFPYYYHYNFYFY